MPPAPPPSGFGLPTGDQVPPAPSPYPGGFGFGHSDNEPLLAPRPQQQQQTETPVVYGTVINPTEVGQE